MFCCLVMFKGIFSLSVFRIMSLLDHLRKHTTNRMRQVFCKASLASVLYGGLSLIYYNGMQKLLSYLHWANIDIRPDSSSDEEAHDKSCVLEASTSSLLAENADMKRRMDCIERQVAELIRGQNSGSESFRRSIDTNYAQEQVGDVDFDFWQFEKDLEHSWVYKRNEHRESMMSFHSSVGRDDAWSELSKLKLAHLSVISVIALPVERSEIVDSSWYQTSTVTANSIIRSRTWAKAPVREKTPMPSQATGSSHAVSLLAAELFKVDSLERQVIRIIDQIALEIRAGSVAGMKSSLDRAEFELSKALRGFKKREETLRRDTSDLQESSLLSYELEIAFALLNACKDKGGRSFCSSLADAERDLYSIKSSHDTQAPCNRKSRVSLAPVRGVLKNMTRNVLKDSIDASRDTHTPPSAEKKSSSLYSLARRRKFGHLDDLVFLYEGLATLDLSDLNLSKLPYRDLQGMTKKLHIIVLDDNRISDFKDVKAFSNDVKVLQIRRNGLMHFPEAILRLRLSSLDISHNYIDQIPTYVTKMAELRELAMQGNAFDKLPAEIWQMEQLERLFVQWEVWRSWCEMNGENVDWRVVERYDEGLYTLGWAELERTRFLPGYEEQ